jgi:uncharacterized membrane protein HdeD (DUF308 family)
MRFNFCGREFQMSQSIDALREHSGWFLGLGIIQALVGLVALGSPLMAGIASALVLGWLLVFSGAAQAAHAFQVREWGGFLLHLLGALLYVVAGMVMITRPIAGVLTLTLVLAIFLLAEGLSRIVLGFRDREAPGSTWFMFGGAMGAVLGLMIWLEWPASAIWAIGLMLGINLLFSGVTLISMALAVRGTPPSADDSAASTA